jgi:hypothetical protein
VSGLSLRQRGPLALETRQRSTISNDLNWDPPHDGVLLQIIDLKKQHPDVMHRDVGPCGTFNCHGLTFAARRTLIHASSEIQKILVEDGYHNIVWSEVMAGDIAIYRTAVSVGGAIEHSGIVVRRDPPIGGIFPEPFILSKWGVCHEAIHRATDCPYSDGCTISYYRIKN